MRRSLLFLPLLTLASSAAAGCRTAPTAGAGAGVVGATTASAAGSRCPAEGSRCASDGEAETCDPSTGAWARRSCDPRSMCLAGGCVSLEVPGGSATPLARGRLLAVRGEGWLNGWSLGASSATGTWKPLCAPDGFVTTTAHAKARLEGLLISARARKVRFEAGFVGGLRLTLNGSVVLDDRRASSPAPFPDELEAIATLSPGVNSLTAVTDSTDEQPAGFWLRVRGLDNQPLPDLLFATARASAACAPRDLRRVEATPAVVAGGFDVTLEAAYRGLAPRGAPELSFTAELIPSNAARPGAGTLRGGERALGAEVHGTLRLDELATGGARALIPVRPGAPGSDLLVSFADPPDGTADLDSSARRFPLTYQGALHERVVALRGRLGALPPGLPEGSVASLDQHVSALAEALAEGEPDRGWLEARTVDAERLIADARAGADPYRAKTGLVFRAYRSPLDGRLQPYLAYVPPRHRPDGKRMPLIVVVHGLTHGPEHALRTLIGQGPDDTMSLASSAHHLPYFPDYGALLVAPWVYGPAGGKPLGEDDVLRVIEEMKRSYRVDERRVSLTGYSMGGTVSFTVPLHYPDRFSAAAPLCGYPNLTSYDSVRNVPHAPWEEVLLAKRYIVNYAENGLHLPLHIVHGGLDAPARSAVVADRYRALGYPRIFDVPDAVDHKIQDYAYKDARMVGWLAQRERPEVPAHVRLVTGEYRYDRAYWVRLLAMRDSALGPGAGVAPGSSSRLDADPEAAHPFADLDATWARAEREVRVATRNVAAFALDVEALGGKVARLLVDGQALEAPRDGGPAFLRWEGGAWLCEAAPPPSAGKKHAGVAGPLDDVLRHRQLVVYGTLDPAQTEANRLVAEHFAELLPARFPVKADAEVTDAELRGRSLVLIGNPASNRITRTLAAGLPVTFEPGALTVRGVRHEGEDVGVSLIFPNPRDPEEYVVLHAGVTARGTLESRHLPQLAPDWLVYDHRITAQRGGLLLDRRVVLAGGFFDDDWR